MRRDQELCKPPGSAGISLQSCNNKNKPYKKIKPCYISIRLPFFARPEQTLDYGSQFLKVPWLHKLNLGYTNLLCVSLINLSFT